LELPKDPGRARHQLIQARARLLTSNGPGLAHFPWLAPGRLGSRQAVR
jgi:hypothetical protein